MQNFRLPEINIVVLTGRLTHDVDVRYTARGDPVAHFTIASTYYKKVGNDWKKETDFIPCCAFGATAQACSEKLVKGSPVQLNGKLYTKSWDDQHGKKHYATEVFAQRVQFLQKAESESDETVDAVGSEHAEPPAGGVPNAG